MHELERSRHALEVEAQSLREQTQELEEELSEAENSRLRLEVTLQALRAQFEREISAKEEKGEEKRRALNKQVSCCKRDTVVMQYWPNINTDINIQLWQNHVYLEGNENENESEEFIT